MDKRIVNHSQCLRYRTGTEWTLVCKTFEQPCAQCTMHVFSEQYKYLKNKSQMQYRFNKILFEGGAVRTAMVVV